MEACVVFYRNEAGELRTIAGHHNREDGMTLFDFPEGEWKLSKVMIGNEVVSSYELEPYHQVIIDKLRLAFQQAKWPMYSIGGRMWMQVWFPEGEHQERLQSIGLDTHWVVLDSAVMQAARLGLLTLSAVNTPSGMPSMVIGFQ
jgi:hypothetical protein